MINLSSAELDERVVKVKVYPLAGRPFPAIFKSKCQRNGAEEEVQSLVASVVRISVVR